MPAPGPVAARVLLEVWPSGQWQQTVNLPGFALPRFESSRLHHFSFPVFRARGSNSGVESQPSKLLVAGSNPVSRSIIFSQKVRCRSAQGVDIGWGLWHNTRPSPGASLLGRPRRASCKGSIRSGPSWGFTRIWGDCRIERFARWTLPEAATSGQNTAVLSPRGSVVEHFLGKEGVTGSNPVVGSIDS